MWGLGTLSFPPAPGPRLTCGTPTPPPATSVTPRATLRPRQVGCTSDQETPPSGSVDLTLPRGTLLSLVTDSSHHGPRAEEPAGERGQGLGQGRGAAVGGRVVVMESGKPCLSPTSSTPFLPHPHFLPHPPIPASPLTSLPHFPIPAFQRLLGCSVGELCAALPDWSLGCAVGVGLGLGHAGVPGGALPGGQLVPP